MCNTGKTRRRSSLDDSCTVLKNETGRESAIGDCRQKKRMDERKSVEFSTVEIRYYPIQLTVHPDCLCGPGIGLSWRHTESNCYVLDDYEDAVADIRLRYPMRLPRHIREKLLKDAGYSRQEMNQVVSEQNEILFSRRKCQKRLINNTRIEKAIIRKKSIMKSKVLSIFRNNYK